MSNELAQENLRLRRQLKSLLLQARQNQQLLERHQSLDLQFIGAAGFRELSDTIFRGLAVSTLLDMVTMSLLDPSYDIRRMLAELNISQRELPQLLFLQNEDEFGDLQPLLCEPVLGEYAEPLHGALFPEPLTAPASVAVLPLIRRGRLIGSLNLGSMDQARFAPGMGTEFIGHMAAIVAVCLENALNHERLKHIGLTDPLTGVNNRRYVERRLLEEIGRSRRHGHALACLFVDIDHFKQINDRYGHQAGDEVLRMVAERIKAELRLSDALGRYGGEEFIVLLIDAELADAACVAERVRSSIAEQALPLRSGEQVNVTVSIGVAALRFAQADETEEVAARNIVAQADQALYQAKKRGRNRVVGANID